MIPGIMTYADTDEMYATMSNIGGYMQPQGMLQLAVDMVAGNLDPQVRTPGVSSLGIFVRSPRLTSRPSPTPICVLHCNDCALSASLGMN